MNSKTLSSINGPLLQITLTPWELTVLRATVELASIPKIAAHINEDKFDTDPYYVDNQGAGDTLRSFLNALGQNK